MVSSAKADAAWRNRIVGSGVKPASEFMANPDNWRVHPSAQQDALAGVLSEVGWVEQVVENVRTGNLVNGHLRVELALRQGDETPVPYVQVDLSEEEERLILATLDPIGAMASADDEKLSELIAGIETEDEAIQALLSSLAGDGENPYQSKIETPVYEPRGDPVEVSQLYDRTRADELAAEIEKADIPDDVREFLRVAATRHIVFNYRNIAEYYSRAPADVQRLMEDSALVIVDVGRAIENGYMHIVGEISDMYREDTGDGHAA
jgi:hypothetical protein